MSVPDPWNICLKLASTIRFPLHDTISLVATASAASLASLLQLDDYRRHHSFEHRSASSLRNICSGGKR